MARRSLIIHSAAIRVIAEIGPIRLATIGVTSAHMRRIIIIGHHGLHIFMAALDIGTVHRSSRILHFSILWLVAQGSHSTPGANHIPVVVGIIIQ
ncbi:MAG: hypothetical protein VW995_14520 [Deltaproteobacteria bacterium]